MPLRFKRSSTSRWRKPWRDRSIPEGVAERFWLRRWITWHGFVQYESFGMAKVLGRTAGAARKGDLLRRRTCERGADHIAHAEHRAWPLAQARPDRTLRAWTLRPT